jgi:hypothetical protein
MILLKIKFKQNSNASLVQGYCYKRPPRSNPFNAILHTTKVRQALSNTVRVFLKR